MRIFLPVLIALFPVLTDPPPPRLTVRPHEMATGTRTVRAGELLLDSLKGTWVYVPQQCVGTRRVPLVVLLGGGGWSGKAIMELERHEADTYGMIILAPNATTSPGVWDILVDQTREAAGPQNVTNPVYPTDVKNLDTAMHQVLRQFAIDPDKIALVGYSNGGSYALFVGRYNVDVFSRIAPLSALFPLGQGTSPRNATTRFLLSGGILEDPDGGMIPQTLEIAQQVRQDGHSADVLLGLRTHSQYEPDFAYMWNWLKRSWASDSTAQTISRAAIDSDPVLTVKAMTQMTTFWAALMREPAEVLTTGRMANQEYVTMFLGQQQVSVIKTNMVALAAKYPSVAADLASAGLTAHEEEAYRAAIVRVGFTRLADTLAGSVAETSVLGKNLAFRKTHDQEFRALAKTGMWVTQ